MNEPSPHEQRGATRYEIEGEVDLLMLDKTVKCHGQLKDISDTGLFISTDTSPEDEWVGTNAEIHMLAKIGEQEAEIKGDIRIVRSTEQGLGVYINAIYPEYRMSFVKLMINTRKQQ